MGSVLPRLLFPALAFTAIFPSRAEAADVLWYNGNSGTTSTTYTTFQSTIEGLGGTFTATSTFPSSMTDYEVVFLVSPTRLFYSSSIAVIEEFLAAGGTLVLLGDAGGTAGALGVLNNLATDLDLESQFETATNDTGCGDDGAGYEATATGTGTSSALECIDTLSYSGSSDITVGDSAEALFTGESDQTVIALEGSVLFVADREIFLDTCTLSDNNVAFFKSLHGGFGADSDDDDCDGYSSALDCDDSDDTVHPGAEDICDGLDNDCDGDLDDDPAYGTVWYYDADNDGYGVTSATIIACDDQDYYADNTRDCNDGDSDINPDANEVCDGVDNNCDGDRDNDPVDGTAYYPDADEDGYGGDASSILSCEEVEGYISEGGDCDDTLARVHPGAEEYCNDTDDDCDDAVDEDAANATSYYTDADGDGYGDPNSVVEACDQPDGAVSDGRDCDDSSAEIYPGAPGWTVACDPLDTGAEDTGGGGGKTGCDCSTSSGGAGIWMLAGLVGLLARRRRA